MLHCQCTAFTGHSATQPCAPVQCSALQINAMHLGPASYPLQETPARPPQGRLFDLTPKSDLKGGAGDFKWDLEP